MDRATADGSIAKPLTSTPSPTVIALQQAAERSIASIRAYEDSLGWRIPEGAERDFYCRDMIQAVLRIRLNNEVDARCLTELLHHNNTEGAEVILAYLSEEYGHDEMLALDLEAMGVSRAEIDATQPLLATKLLMAYIETSTRRDGFLPDLVWAWFIELYSAGHNDAITRAAGNSFGQHVVRLTTDHLTIDASLNHRNRLEAHLQKVLDTDESLVPLALSYLDDFTTLLKMYTDQILAEPAGLRED